MIKKKILSVEKGSIAAEMGIEAGDFLLAINDIEIVDVFDYQILLNDDYLEVLIEKPDGEQWLLEIDKDEGEQLGLAFEGDGLMDVMRHCGNNCLFCFIDQNPKGMRPSLYVKDDDYRLSFLHGNYITLTNINQSDIERILRHRISPVNISIHATDADLRVRMMGNPKAGNSSLDFLGDLVAGGISLALQIVLCKGINDGDHLDKTISDLSKFIPEDGSGEHSLSVVPVGITKHREGLHPLETFTADDCLNLINQINRWQNKILEEKGTRFVFAADEFYLKAGVGMPDADDYEDFLQIDNGVGMIAALKQEFDLAVGAATCRPHPTKSISLITGVAASDFIKKLVKDFKNLSVKPIINNFFGENITVSGLLTGADIIRQLKGQNLGDMVLLPKNCLKADEPILLDDVSLTDLERELGVPVVAVEILGGSLLEAIV